VTGYRNQCLAAATWDSCASVRSCAAPQPRSGIIVIARSCMLASAPDGMRFRLAPLAQSAERLHGKEKVYGSIP
jgi:hypothetical protein